MSRLLFAIGLALAVQAATAEAAQPMLPQSPAATATTAAVAAAGVMQASLSLSEKEAKGTQSGKPVATAKASLKADDSKDADEGDGRRPTTGAMLLAALALMTGIALRRGGAGQQ